MTWVLLLTAAWLAVSMPIALLVAHAIRSADRQAGHPEARPLSLLGRPREGGGPGGAHLPHRRRADRR